MPRLSRLSESPYMQYFCGLHEFTDKPIFDPSLFVTIRKRISEEELNKMTVKLLDKQKRLLVEKRKREEEGTRKSYACNLSHSSTPQFCHLCNLHKVFSNMIALL